MADYDNAEVTERERKAAANTKTLASYNADATKNQLKQQLENYDFANAQNRSLADTELKQNSRKNSADMFSALLDLQNSALGLAGSMGSALNGSSLYNLQSMLDRRLDQDNNSYWTQHQVNQDAVNNAYEEAANQNQVAKNDAIINAEKALADMQSDLAANLNNINPTLFEEPGSGDTDLGASGYYDANKVAQRNSEISGYLMPDTAVQTARSISGRNKLQGNDYFSRLVNSYNGYRS